MHEYFQFIAYIIICIFELSSILLSLSFMIEILEISNKFIKLLLSSNYKLLMLILSCFMLFMFGIKIKTNMHDIIQMGWQHINKQKLL
jgi:hypothetical protein